MTTVEHGYTIDEEASSERELRDFLKGLVRVVRPSLVVETGTYLGRAALAISEALAMNLHGWLVTCDVREYTPASYFHGRRITLRQCRGVDLPELRQADLVFLDSDYRERRAEFDLVKPGALVVIHDTRISYDSEVPPHETWVRELGGLLFETHRGFALVRKA